MGGLFCHKRFACMVSIELPVDRSKPPISGVFAFRIRFVVGGG